MEEEEEEEEMGRRRRRSQPFELINQHNSSAEGWVRKEDVLFFTFVLGKARLHAVHQPFPQLRFNIFLV